MYKRHYSVNSQHNTTQNRPKFDLVSECRTAHSIVVCLRLHKRDNVCLDWVRKRNQVIPAYQPSCQLQVHTVSVYMCIPSLSPGFPEKYWIFFKTHNCMLTHNSHPPPPPKKKKKKKKKNDLPHLAENSPGWQH